MSELPTGTVSLLFSDIEGSTALLKRLGPAYAQALDGQRRVLRKAWTDHGGTELGTEGDSFYVVFPTAEAAVAAAAQGQRDLAGFEWPGGEQVRVRMGIHTGSPTMHEGAYVGMDVHRAARIAGAAHGGQVLLSDATSKLVTECLPEQVTVKNLGSHQLKDISNPEPLFQLAIEGLHQEFPPPKTLGTASSLPRPATPLVGRDGELAELTALLSSPEVRLVTLTGPGGSGKTRLAIGVAERLADRFPDGVYFVPLAAVTSADVMWTSIAEVLDVPPEGRIPPGFFDHVAHRTALFVLDNLEQIEGADTVVAELLDHAPQAVAIATSRKPLAVPAEHVHPVPPLELPEGTDLGQAQAAGAIQLFLQHARKVKPSFTLTADNAGDVTTVCRRLDGLPLAIELAAARTRFLTPKALVARLDKALDIAATGNQAPSRQKTLRETIAWSCNLLTDQQQAFFRRLGVFAGGADLDAVAAITADVLRDADPLDLIAELVDASLFTITESADGEPRVGMLETIRAYALEQLKRSGEIDSVRELHARYYVHLAEETHPLLVGDTYLAARNRFEIEHDNLREALNWALTPEEPPNGAAGLGLRLCNALQRYWWAGSYLAEKRRWEERAIERAGDVDSPGLADCLASAGMSMRITGDSDAAYRYGAAGVSMWYRLGDTSRLARALRLLAVTQAERGQTVAAKVLFEEALTTARATNETTELRMLLGDFSRFLATTGDLDRAMTLNDQVLSLVRDLGDLSHTLTATHNAACNLRMAGRVPEAAQQMRTLIPQVLSLNEPDFLVVLAEDYAAVLAELGDHHRAVRLLGAADAMRERLRFPRESMQQTDIAQPLNKTKAALTPQMWDDAYQAGRNLTVEDALTEAHAATAGIGG